MSVTLSPNSDLSRNKSYIGKPPSAPASSPSNAININQNGNDITAYSRAPLSGSFPGNAGVYLLNVTSRGSFVSIGPDFISLFPSSVSASMGRSQSFFYLLNFSSAYGSPVVVNITSQWAHTSPKLSITPEYFSAYRSSGQIRLNFTSDSDDAGVYSGKLLVTASEVGNPSLPEKFQVPITLSVQAN